MLRCKIFLLQLAIYISFHNVCGIDPQVQTNVGLIKGLRASDGDYSMFMGIPYAKVNESNPFGPSVPYEKFEEPFEAYDDTAICPQVEEFNRTVTGTLDCLHLNIYVPDSASQANPLPVLIWIYGGGFAIGFHGRFLYGPKLLVRHDVIFVTINYRVGPYGFMCHHTPEIPGNQGLKDQLLAQRWIKDNIGFFGGDADKITLFGESAGGMSVDYHLHSPQEKLFNKLILQSGTSYIPASTNEGSEDGTLRLAAQLGLVTNDVNEAVSFLSTLDTDLVITAMTQINSRFVPCVEKLDTADKIIPDYTINTDIPKIKNTSVLIGHNDDEMVASYYGRGDAFWAGLKNFFSHKLQQSFDFEADELRELEAFLRQFYIGDEEITEQVREQVTDFDSDYIFNHPSLRSLNKYLESGADNIYYYVFAYVGGRNFVRLRSNVTIGGAAHCDEIGYLFDISYMTDVPTIEDQMTIDRMTTMWTNFVKYSDPTPETTPLLPVKWERVANESLNYLHIDRDLRLGNRPFRQRFTFWDLFYEFYAKNEKGYRR